MWGGGVRRGDREKTQNHKKHKIDFSPHENSYLFRVFLGQIPEYYDILYHTMVMVVFLNPKVENTACTASSYSTCPCKLQPSWQKTVFKKANSTTGNRSSHLMLLRH